MKISIKQKFRENNANTHTDLPPRSSRWSCFPHLQRAAYAPRPQPQTRALLCIISSPLEKENTSHKMHLTSGWRDKIRSGKNSTLLLQPQKTPGPWEQEQALQLLPSPWLLVFRASPDTVHWSNPGAEHPCWQSCGSAGPLCVCLCQPRTSLLPLCGPVGLSLEAAGILFTET